jgi:hypothetical protein
MKDEALKLALEALEGADEIDCDMRDAITAIKQALAAPVQEPISCPHGMVDTCCENYGECALSATQPAAPVQEDVPKIGCVNHDCDKCKALAAPVQEPVAWICNHYEEGVKNDVDYWQDDIDALPVGTPLYTTPPAAQRQWVGLTKEKNNG